jgi:hypothetical protein
VYKQIVLSNKKTTKQDNEEKERPFPHTQAIPTSSCQATEKTNLIAPGYRPHEANLEHYQKATRERQFL